MKQFRSFRCGNCGDKVEMVAGKGRTREYRFGLQLPIPDDALIPTCRGCGETWLSVEDAAALDALQAPAYAAWQKAHCTKVVDRIQARHGATLREIERACGVTATYLSHVLSGRKEASATLVRLLEAYSLSPSEYVRQRDGGSWAQAALAFSAPRRTHRPPARLGPLTLVASHPQSYTEEHTGLLPPSSDKPVKGAA